MKAVLLASNIRMLMVERDGIPIVVQYRKYHNGAVLCERDDKIAPGDTVRIYYWDGAVRQFLKR